MNKMTIHDQIVDALKARGEKLVLQHRSSKYTVMSNKHGGFYFVGKAGALRSGATASSSISLSHMVGRLLKEKRVSDDKKTTFNPPVSEPDKGRLITLEEHHD
jgi:hypothetical protein